MDFDRKELSDMQLVHFYKELLLPRLIEEKMLLLLRQGRISKWFSGIGQEAVAVGAALALEPDEWILPLHRNLGVFTVRQLPLHKLFAQWQGREDSYSQGRERSFHFGSSEHHICGMISHLGPQLSVADGIALACKLSGQQKATLVFTGDGGSSEGEFHEALNIAAVWDLPVIFLIENNGYGLSTPVQEQYRCRQLSDRAKGYGMEGITIDGNNLTEVFHTIQYARNYCINEQKPVLVECMTFRMRGHEETSGTSYIPQELFAEWEQKDPVVNFETYLTRQNILTEEQVHETRTTLKAGIENELAAAYAHKPVQPDDAKELKDIYAITRGLAADTPAYISPVPAAREKRFIDAITEALQQVMKKYDHLILMGQDIAEYGGAFKVTEGFVQQFGKARVRNTPLCESAVIGTALGLSIMNYKSIVEMQFADFVTCGFNQIVNNLAKIHYRWGQCADVVIRMPTGAGVGAGPFHSQSNEAWFTHIPGLKVVYPSTPQDAKGLLIAAVEDPNPIMYFEHKALYRSISGPVPDEYYVTPLGKARQITDGEDISIITYGLGVLWASEYAAAHPGISFNILDLRTLLPLDHEAVLASVKKTGRVLILHEDTLTGGIGGEVAAWIGEHAFTYLDAPVMRCASLDTPVPFAPELEEHFLAKSRLDKAVRQLIAY